MAGPAGLTSRNPSGDHDVAQEPLHHGGWRLEAGGWRLGTSRKAQHIGHVVDAPEALIELANPRVADHRDADRSSDPRRRHARDPARQPWSGTRATPLVTDEHAKRRALAAASPFGAHPGLHGAAKWSTKSGRLAPSRSRGGHFRSRRPRTP